VSSGSTYYFFVDGPTAADTGNYRVLLRSRGRHELLGSDPDPDRAWQRDDAPRDTRTPTFSTNGSCGGATGPDVVYRITRSTDGPMTYLLDPTYTTFNSVSTRESSCNDPLTETGCSNIIANGGDTLSFPTVSGGVPTFVWVDGSATAGLLAARALWTGRDAVARVGRFRLAERGHDRAAHFGGELFAPLLAIGSGIDRRQDRDRHALAGSHRGALCRQDVARTVDGHRQDPDAEIERHSKAAALELADLTGAAPRSSGAIHTRVPLRSKAPPTSRKLFCACSRSPRSIRTKPAASMACPQIGTLNSSALATIRILPGSDRKRTGMS